MVKAKTYTVKNVHKMSKSITHLFHTSLTVRSLTTCIILWLLERVIEGVDVALLGPQVGYQLGRAKEICEPKGVPVDVIPMQDYGMCNGMNVLKFAYKLAKNK